MFNADGADWRPEHVILRWCKMNSISYELKMQNCGYIHKWLICPGSFVHVPKYCMIRVFARVHACTGARMLDNVDLLVSIAGKAPTLGILKRSCDSEQVV